VQDHTADPFGIVGQVLDAQFRVDRLVGEGGFSAVYRGFHLGLEEPIAIKCLKLPPTLSPPLVEQFEKRFRDESRILYRLSQGNLNIVRSIASGTWQSPVGPLVPFMVLEWLEGRSLANEFTIRRTVGKQGRSLEEVISLFAAAADGLGYAHAQGVVHRDLNPGNLFLASTPQGTKMKVLDFGVAKILDDSALNIGPRTHTVGQIRIFAPAYGAPEQFDDAIGKVGAASDVYAFALILLEALRDRCVNEGTHIGEFAQRAVDPNRRPTPRALGLHVSDEVEEIFARATRLDPRERWQSATELWQALLMAAAAASQERHARAAAETPPLTMPRDTRNTKTGTGVPPEAGQAPGGPRIDNTLPISAVMPDTSQMRAGATPPRPQSSPGIAPPAPRVPVANAPSEAATLESNAEEDVTRVSAPNEALLRGLADAQAAAAQAEGLGTTRAAGSPGAAMFKAASSPDPGQGGGGGAFQLQGTMMMQGGGFSPPPPQRPPQNPLMQTMPLAGPHPLGLPTQKSSGGPLPAAGSPPQFPPQPHPPQAHPPPAQHQQPPQQQLSQQQQPPAHHHAAPPMQVGPPPQQPMISGGAFHQPPSMQTRMGDAMSLPPPSVAGVPKKSNALLIVGLVAGVLALGGAGALLIWMSGKHDSAVPVPSASASATVVASAPPPRPPPPPPERPDPTPPADVTADAGEQASADTTTTGDAGPPPRPTVTTTTEPPPLPVPPPPTPKDKEAGPPPDPNAWNEAAARAKLVQANSILVFCKKADGVTGPGTATVTFNPDGTVGSVTMDPPYAGTPVGDCVAGHFKRTKVNAFTGSPQTIKHSFTVPK
jgi:serine/threonine protein kinase